MERVLGGVRPHLMISDPPYGVDYDPGWRNRAGLSETKRTGKVLNDDRADWREAWALFPGDVAYVWHGALHATTVAESLIACGFHIRAQIVWAKERLVLGRGDFTGSTSHVSLPARWCGGSSSPGQDRRRRRSRKCRSRLSGKATSSCPTIPTRASFGTAAGGSPASASGTIAGCCTPFPPDVSSRGTPEHRFSVRLSPEAADKQVVYLMRRGDWWRVGRVRLFNSRGFGLATRLSDNRAEEAWIISVHGTTCQAVRRTSPVVPIRHSDDALGGRSARAGPSVARPR